MWVSKRSQMSVWKGGRGGVVEITSARYCVALGSSMAFSHWCFFVNFSARNDTTPGPVEENDEACKNRGHIVEVRER